MPEKNTDTPPERSLAQRSGDNPAGTIGKGVKRTLDFTTTAVTEHTERSKGYKLVSLVFNLVSLAGLILAILSGVWWLPLVFAFLLQCSLFYVLHAVRLYHERTINNLDASHQSEIKSLSEGYDESLRELREKLEDEQAKNAKPDIHGEIKEVFYDSNYSLLSGPDESGGEFRHLYDFFFTVNVYVKNERTPTTIQGYRFVLRTNGGPKEGVRQSLADCHVERSEHPLSFGSVEGRIVTEPLVDIEEKNDQPLEHGRGGWLRFHLAEVPEEGEREIEISVIDKSGDSHPLVALPRSEWRINTQDSYPRIVCNNRFYFA